MGNQSSLSLASDFSSLPYTREARSKVLRESLEWSPRSRRGYEEQGDHSPPFRAENPEYQRGIGLYLKTHSKVRTGSTARNAGKGVNRGLLG